MKQNTFHQPHAVHHFQSFQERQPQAARHPKAVHQLQAMQERQPQAARQTMHQLTSVQEAARQPQTPHQCGCRQGLCKLVRSTTTNAA